MIYDVVIIGGGPAGLTAAIYAARARLKTLVVESLNIPAQAVLTSDIENYPGFPEGLNGFELVERFKKQAVNFGAEFTTKEVKGIKPCEKENKSAWEADLGGEKIYSLSVIIATGASPRKLGIPGEEKFRGKGVSYCAVCDGAFFKNKHVALVGGGDTAIEEAIFLTNFADKVTVIHRKDSLRATKILQERAFSNKKITFLWSSAAKAITGDEKVKGIKVENLKGKKEESLACDGVFIFVGYEPNTKIFKGTLDLDKDGYILADDDMKTSKKGVFACGDARKKLLRQIVTACGEGATAAFSARLYVEELKGAAYK